MTADRVLHCWADGPSILDWIEAGKDATEFVGSTCMLEKHHDGPHEFTPDDQIGIMAAERALLADAPAAVSGTDHARVRDRTDGGAQPEETKGDPTNPFQNRTQWAADMREVAAEPPVTAREERLREALQEFVECALFDPMMEGPRFKGWNRSALDRFKGWNRSALDRALPKARAALDADRKDRT